MRSNVKPKALPEFKLMYICLYVGTCTRIVCLYYPHLHKGLKHLLLPVFIVVCQSWWLACVSLHHQTFHLDQQGTNGMILPAEGVQKTAAMLFLEIVIILYMCMYEYQLIQILGPTFPSLNRTYAVVLWYWSHGRLYTYIHVHVCTLASIRSQAGWEGGCLKRRTFSIVCNLSSMSPAFFCTWLASDSNFVILYRGCTCIYSYTTFWACTYMYVQGNPWRVSYYNNICVHVRTWSHFEM